MNESPPPSGPPPPGDLVACQARLAELQREFDHFTYAVAHDLRAPLRAVTGFLDALHDDHARDLPASGQAYLQRAIDAAGRTQRMLEALLRLNRLARHPLERQPTALADLVASARIEAMHGVTDREVEWQIGPLPVVSADRLLVQEALVQIFANALKFTRPRARAVIAVYGVAGAPAPTVAVRDNGVGFNAARAENLGQPFARFHGQQEFEGIGAGLAIVASIVRRHGGRLQVESREGEGTTTSFSLGAANA